MSGFGIIATFPLGTYTGHKRDGSSDPFPDAARLHAALLNAAGQGSAAVLDRNELRPSDQAIGALKWVEENPPTGIRLPRIVRVAATDSIAYRAAGLIPKEGRRWVDDKTV